MSSDHIMNHTPWCPRHFVDAQGHLVPTYDINWLTTQEADAAEIATDAIFNMIESANGN